MGDESNFKSTLMMVAIAMTLNVVIYFLLTKPETKLSETPQHWNDWSPEDREWKETNPAPPSAPVTPSIPETLPTPKTFQDAKLLSVKTQKSIFAVFSMEGCPACQTMKQTLASPEAKVALAQYIVIEVDAVNDPDAATMGIDRVPTVILLRPDGQIAKRSVGAMTVEKLKSWIK